MDFFNYFIKAFIRVFTRKFFWVILVAIFIFLGFIVFSSKSNAVGTYVSSVDFFYNGQWYNDIDFPDNYKFYSIIRIDNNVYMFTSNNNGFYYQASNTFLYTWQKSNFGDRIYCNVYKYSFDNNAFVLDKSGVNSYSFTYNGLRNKTLYNLSSNTTVWYIGKTGSEPSLTNSVGEIGLDEPMYFVTNSAQMCDLNYDYLQISGGGYQYLKTLAGVDIHATLSFIYTYKGIEYELPFDYTWVSYVRDGNFSYFYVNIPKNALHSVVNIQPNTYFEYRLDYLFPFPDPLNPVTTSVSTGELMYVITQDEADKINMDSERYLQVQAEKERQKQLEEQIKQTQAMQDINDSINNPNVDSSVLGDMPQASTINDNTGIARYISTNV